MAMVIVVVMVTVIVVVMVMAMAEAGHRRPSIRVLGVDLPVPEVRSPA
jgi:hypothetical protein